MAYNRWLSAAPPVSEEDLLHYGVVGMKWGVRKARYYAKKASFYNDQIYGTGKKVFNPMYSADKRDDYYRKYIAEVQKLKYKGGAKLSKLDATTVKRSATSAGNYYRAQNKASSILSSKKSTEKAFDRAAKSQRSTNRALYKEAKFYKEFLKALSDVKKAAPKNLETYDEFFKKSITEIDNDLRMKGERAINNLNVSNQILYGSDVNFKRLKHDIGFDVVTAYLGNEVVEGFDLLHHQVKGAKWGVKNGPPYPLSRQERFSKDGKTVDKEVYKRVQAKASGSGGHANPSTYKKTKAEVRTEKKAVRKANPNGTPQDQEEKNSLFARIKRANREKEAQRKQQQAENEQRQAKDKAAMERLMSSDLPDSEKNNILNELTALGFKAEVTNKAERIDNAINAYHQKQADAKAAQEAEREAVKKHGTAEEVMKFRETFTTEEWNDIARRLEAEERVKRFLTKTVENIPERIDSKNQNNSSRAASESEQKAMKGLNSNEKKIFLSGDARTVFENKTKFTPEQLRAVTNRLDAEEKVGQYANRQITLDSAKYLKFKNTIKWINTAGQGAESLYKIAKLIDPTIGNDKNIKGAKTNTDAILNKLDGLIKSLEKGGSNGGGQQHFSGKKEK